jgi:hypothetical protein
MAESSEGASLASLKGNITRPVQQKGWLFQDTGNSPEYFSGGSMHVTGYEA